MRYKITALGGAGRSVTQIANAIVNYLRQAPAARPAASETAIERGPARYYSDGTDEAGRWLGHGAAVLDLHGRVDDDDFASVLAGRDPHTGERLITAQGSAGRRAQLGAGEHTRLSPDGQLLFDATDAAAVLDVTNAEAQKMLTMGAALTGPQYGPGAQPPRRQPPGSYLVPVRLDGQLWVTATELERCVEARATGTAPRHVAATGDGDDELPLAEAARIAGVTKQYLRRVAKRYETEGPAIAQADPESGRHRAYLVARRGPRNEWIVTRRHLVEFLERRDPPPVRVGFDATLTTEKSLGVLALLSDDATRKVVLDAIQGANDWALAWLEAHHAVAREDGRVIPVRGWTVASFRHYTSRAQDPFPHHHNVVCNTAEDHNGVRRALDARSLYRGAHAASALATAEMRYRLTTSLGVRWRPSRHGGWEIAGIPDDVLREFSRRRTEIEEAMDELAEAIGRSTTVDEIDRIALATRPEKVQAAVEALLTSWWQRAEGLGFRADDLAACVHAPVEPSEPAAEAIFARLAAPDGLCQNLSIFNRGDLLHALANLAIDGEDPDPQPLLVPAARLEEIADEFLSSRWVEQLGDPTETAPARYTTREMLAVQDRIVARFRQGRHRGAALVPAASIDAALGRHPKLTDEQRDLVRGFCSSGHKIQCAVGRPGAGKTTAMAAARGAWQAAGLRVLGAAVKGEAARTLGATAGIPTETLAWYLAHEDPLHSPLDARTVLVVDEASTVSDRDLDQLGWLAEQTGATLRLIGDPAQHSAVQAGGMFRVLCERHDADTPELVQTHRLQDPHDRAAADHLRAGDVANALDELDAAGHLHIVDDDLHAYTHVLTRWWQAHEAGHHHPMVNRRNDIRRALNRLAHQLRRTAGEIGTDEITAAEDRRYGVGDRVIARIPNRRLHPPGDPNAYVRNGATGTITALRPGPVADDDRITVDFDDLGVIDLPRRFFDEHDIDHHGRRDVGIDHAYAVTSYAVTGATYPVSTSRIDETSSRAETYVDITRGQQANHLYLTRHRDDIDHEQLPRVPPEPIDQAISHHLAASQGERTAWELREDKRALDAQHAGMTLGL